MKRIMRIQITSCYECHHLGAVYGFSTHFYICPFLEEETGDIIDFESDQKAKKDIKKWFEMCPRWEKE